MHAAGASQFNLPTSPSKESPTGSKSDETAFVSEISDAKVKAESSELMESVLEQKILNDTLDLIQIIENSLTASSYDNYNGNYIDNLSESFLQSLMDESCVQFKVQIPNLLPKMHFVCEIGSRVLFRTIDWFRDLQVFPFFSTDTQSEMLKMNWIELLVIGIAQTCSTSSQNHLKSMIVSTLVNYVKSLLILSEQNQKSDGKPTVKGRKIKKMLNNITMLNKFIDNFTLLELDAVEYAHIRLISFFNPNKIYTTEIKLKSYQDKINENLRKHQRTHLKSSEDRLIGIYQSLAILPSLDVKIIEKLFFNILVDFIKIDNVIPYLINLNAGAGEHKFDFKHEKEYEFDENSPSINSDDQRYYNYSDGGDDKA